MTRLLLAASNSRLVIPRSCPVRRQLPTTGWVHFISGTLVGLVLTFHLCPLAHAQYTADFQTNIISGVTSNWSGDYIVGSNSVYDALLIQNSGVLSNGYGYVGLAGGSSNNMAVVSGAGSVWKNSNELYIGGRVNNQLIVTNGGVVYSPNGYVGYPYGNLNSVLVTGSGSVWNNTGDLLVGAGQGQNDSLTISDGGAVYDNKGMLGWSSLSVRNSVLVTGSGSVWSNRNDLSIGDAGGSSLTISNGGDVYSDNAVVGGDEDESVLVTGVGSVWNNSGEISIGGARDSLTISDSGAVYCGRAVLSGGWGAHALVTGAGSVWSIGNNLYISGGNGAASLTIADGGVVFAPSVSSDYMITASGGGLYVTNGFGTGVLAANAGTLTIDGGTVTADQLLVISNSAYYWQSSSSFAFTSGLLNSGGTFVTNGQNFAVGDGTNGAVFELVGGFHSFADGLLIRSSAFLTGCGTIDGSVVVDPGGTVWANCGGTFDFTGAVTNDGSIVAVNGTFINFYGPVVNNGMIDGSKGHLRFWSDVQNNGTIVPDPASALHVTSITRQGNDIRVAWICEAGNGYALQSTRAAGVAGYTTNFADISPIIMVSGTGLVQTNYLDVGAMYAPSVTSPGGAMVTSSNAPSTVDVSAVNTRGLADSLGQALPVGSLLMLGTFSISESAIQSNFSAGNIAAIMSAFTPYTNSFAVGDGTGLAASWDVLLSAPGFGGQRIYLLAIDSPTLAAANHLGIFTAPSWVFPGEGGEVDIDLDDVTDFVIGTRGGPLTINLGLGPPYVFDDSARLSFLPGRNCFYRVRLVP